MTRVTLQPPQAIPTLFGGVLHRSRTEAKWAKFMTDLRIPFSYEVEGWDTGGEWYLPDFVIFGALGMLWTEIKPTYDADPKGVAKWRRFAAQRPQPSRAALIIGEPGKYKALVIGGDQEAAKPVQGPWEDDTLEWRPCPAGYHFDLTWPGKFGGKLAEDACEPCASKVEERMEQAARDARSHRFGRPGAAA